MRLVSFAVRGFKNLVNEVSLADLGAFEVIHGENNVGKSNLLQAIDLFFALMESLAEQVYTNEFPTNAANTVWWRTDERARTATWSVRDGGLRRPYGVSEAFNLDQPTEVTMAVRFELTDAALGLIGVDETQRTVSLVVRLTPTLGAATIDLTYTRDAAGALWGFSPAHLGLFLATNLSTNPTGRGRSFSLVDTFRRVVTSAQGANEVGSELRRTLPHDLQLELYDCKESVEPGLFLRWDLFANAMNSLGPLVGDGQFVITFNRAQGRATLALQRGRVRIPIDSLGSGVQQFASLMARVLLANSAIVAIEEPELNLHYELQLKLRDALRGVVASGTGPQQILVASHSPAFEAADTFFAMYRGLEGPVVERRPVREAMTFLHQAGVQLPTEGGAYGYVSREGLLRLSDAARAALGVEKGGGVVVRKRADHPYVEILTNEQALAELHGEEPAS